MGCKMILTVAVTCFNEHKTIIQAIEEAKLIDIADKEIIVIDNCSTDGTRELLEKYNDPEIKMILQDKNYGFGRSIELALETAKGKYTYIHHADCEYDYHYLPQFITFAEENNLDIVLGSRTKNFKGTKIDLMRERPEYLASIISTWLINVWYDKKFTDIIGSRLYKTETIKNVKISTYGAGFDFESISRICKYGLKINEIAIGYKARADSHDKKIKPYHMINALYAMFKVRYFEK